MDSSQALGFGAADFERAAGDIDAQLHFRPVSWLVPELTASAMEEEAAEIHALQASEIYSSSRTCEIGLTRATGVTARSFIHLLERATRV